jgi:hypothetical protein
MANAKRQCKYKPCSMFARVEEGVFGAGKKFYCSVLHRHTAEQRKPRAKVTKLKPKKAKSIAKLVDEAAVLLQKLVRMKAADESGMVKSFTSGKVLHWTEMQGSHFIQRNRTATKLLEENVHPQTPGENMYEMKTASGVLDYRRAMVEFYGEDFVRWLEDESKKTKKYTRAEVEEITAYFKQQIAIQEERLAGKAQNQEAA